MTLLSMRTRTILLTLGVWSIAGIAPTPGFADNHVGLSQSDIEAASRAALTTRGFTGAIDTSVMPPADLQRIADLQRTRERAAAEHGQQLTNLLGTLNQQQSELADARQRLATGEANLASYERDETWYEAAGDFLISTFTSQQNQGTRARSMIRDANADIERLEAQVENTRAAIGTTTQSIASYNERIDLEMRLADPVQRRAEEADRMQNLVQIVTDVETQRAQIGAGQAQFNAQTAALDAAIEEARQLQRSGEVDEDYADDLVDRYEEEKETIEASQEEWLRSMYSELERHESLRDYYFEQNRDDRVGATSTEEVLDELRLRAEARGEDPARATGIDREALAATEGGDGQPGSAAQFTASAVNMPRFNSIFDGIDSDSVNEFLYDLKEDELDWYEFSLRMGSYTKGVTRAGVDAVTDLAMLLKELGDTQGEVFESAIEQMFGVELDVFGDENLRLLARVRDQAYLLFDTDNPEGRRVAEDLQRLVENLTRAAQRRLETQAAEGDVHKTLEDVGYVAGTIVGVEEVGLRVAGAALRGTAVLWRAADTASDLAQANRAAQVATDTSRATSAATGTSRAAGGASDGSRAAGAGSDASRADAASDATRPFDETIPTPDDNATVPPPQGDPNATTPPPTGDPNATVPPPTGDATQPFDEVIPVIGEDDPTFIPGTPPGGIGSGAPTRAGTRAGNAAADASQRGGQPRRVPTTSNDVVRVEVIDADTVVLHREGHPPVEAKRIPGAAGATSVVYEVPGRPDLVVKFTKPGGASALDVGGANVVNRIDPGGEAIRVPQSFEHLNVRDGPQNGGTLTVQERAPDAFNRATGTHAPGGGMTPAQHRAFRRAMDKLNDEGFVWLDAKHDNYAFELAPSPPAEPGELRLVVVDPGGIVPMKNLDPQAARDLQRALEDPGRYGYNNGRWGIWQGAVMEGLADEFDHLIDWDAIRNLTGIDYRSLDPFTEAGVAFPFNPKNGVDYPQLLDDPPPLERAAAGASGAAPTGDAGTSRAREAVDTARQALDRSARAGLQATGEGLDAAGRARTTRAAGRAAATGRDEDEGGSGDDSGTAISVAGGFMVPVINPIYFAFGPNAEIIDYVGLYTNCPPCTHLTDEYNRMLATKAVFTPIDLALLTRIEQALPACERHYCPSGFLDPSLVALIQIVRVVTIFGNTPYNTLNPTGADGSNTSTGNLVPVLALNGGGFARLSQWTGSVPPETPVSGPIGCAERHYHEPQVIDPPLIDCDGNSRSDARSSGCGFGTVGDVTFIPADQCPNP